MVFLDASTASSNPFLDPFFLDRFPVSDPYRGSIFCGLAAWVKGLPERCSCPRGTL